MMSRLEGQGNAWLERVEPSMAAGEPVRASNLSLKWRQVISENGLRPGPRSGAASVVFENSLYIFGGYGGNGRLDDIWEYRFIEHQWVRLETRGTPPAGRENNGAVVYNDGMYVFGGYSGQEWLNDFHRLDFRTLEWTLILGREGNPPSTRFGYVSAVWKDSFIVFGGYDGSTWLNDLHEFDFLHDRWTRIETTGSGPSVRSCPSWVCYNHCLYIFGGYDGVHRMNDFYELDLETRIWKPVVFSGPAPSPRYFHSSVVHKTSMYLFGGYNGTDRLQDLYQFSFEKKTWKRFEVQNAPSGRSSLVAQVYGNSMYIFGGYDGRVVLNDFHEFKYDIISIPKSTFLADLRLLINNPMLTDVTFVVEGHEVHANRAILAARSQHFRAMLFGGMREQHEQRVYLHDISYGVFMALLEFLYTDSVKELSIELALPLLIAAEQYMLDRLKALCEDSIRKKVNKDTVIPILRASHHHRSEALKEICMEFVCKRYEEVKHTKGFKELLLEPELMMELLMKL